MKKWFSFLALMVWASHATALIPAFLPKDVDVPPGQAMDIDGVWRVSTINKRIRIDRGRAYAVDTWLHALILRVQPGMVVMKNIQETEYGTYQADDLPLMGRASMTMLDDGRLDVTVNSGARTYRYELIPEQSPETYAGPAGVPSEPYIDDPDAVLPEQTTPAPIPERVPPPRRGKKMPPPPEFVSYEAYTGCQPDEASAPPEQTPRERIEAVRVDRITQRTFASFSLDEVEAGAGTDDMQGLCWKRLDGVWQESGLITLDHSLNQPEIWGVDAPELVVLANGNYTDLRHLFIGSVGRDDEEVWVADALTNYGFVRFLSDDGIGIEEALQPGGPVKVFRAESRSYLGSTLELDLTASKRPRLRLGGVSYLRPESRLSEAAMSNQTASDDAFLLSYNLENLTASRKGYDVVKQDPFYLLDNRKLEVFAEVDAQRYVITEQRTVPLGLKFLQEGAQGMVYSKKMSTSGTEYQRSVAVTLGGSYDGKAEPTGFLAKTSVSVDASLSWLTSMQKNESVAQALGYSRAKLYALVLDHPYVTLSDDFIDAIGDAVRFGRYQHIIERFGTHYPYAVTYGSAAKITQSITEESFREFTEWNAGIEAEYAGGVLGQNGSVRGSLKAGMTNGTSGSIGNEGATFVAVGGNGSWSEAGYSAGKTPYPVLLDLRPIYELLSPMNFPDQPEVYTTVRDGLRFAVKRYMQTQANKVSSASLLPEIRPVIPEQVETWHLYVRHAWCTGKGSGFVKSATGTLDMEAFIGSRSRGVETTKRKTFEAKCKKKRQTETYSYSRGSAGLIEVKGTRAQIAKYSLALDMRWRYKPSLTKKWRRHEKTFPTLKAMRSNLPVGKSQDQTWKVGAKNLPDFVLSVRAKRIK